MCSSFQYDGSSNQIDNEATHSDTKKSFEHSLDSIEIDFKNSLTNNITNTNSNMQTDSDFPLFNNTLHIVEDTRSVEHESTSNVVTSSRPDHDYEVIKKSDDNLLNDDSNQMQTLEDMSLDINESQNLIDDVEEVILPTKDIKVKTSKSSGLVNIFSSETNQYSLLNTKIAEESEDDTHHEK